MYTRKQTISIGIFYIHVINRTEFCEWFTLGRTILPGTNYAFLWDNVTATDGLSITYYVFNIILFDYLKPYQDILPDPDMEKALMYLTSDILHYGLWV